MKKLVSIILTVALLASFALPALAEDTIKIGGIACLTGPAAMYGVGVKNGVDLYISELNAAGGINGQQVGSSGRIPKLRPIRLPTPITNWCRTTAFAPFWARWFPARPTRLPIWLPPTASR